MFHNRKEAGMMLAKKLRVYQGIPGVLLAVPRGGVPVAYEIAKELGLPLELMLVKKLGHPFNKEYAIGAVGLYDEFVNPGEHVTEEYIDEQVLKIRRRLKEMQHKFLGDREPENIEGKTIIIVDDGVATGNTLLATIHILKKARPAKIVVAAPVMSMSAYEKLRDEADEVVSLLLPEIFHGVGLFYNDFTQVTDEEVSDCIKKLTKPRHAGQ